MDRIVSTEVRYCDCDPMGIVNNSVYAVWCEMGRLDYLESIGMTFEKQRELNVSPALVLQKIEYFKAVKFPSKVQIKTYLASYSNRKIILHYEIIVADTVVAKNETVVVWFAEDHSVDLSTLAPECMEKIKNSLNV